METDDPQLLDDWIAHWSDIVDFEVYPVITSAEAAERIHDTSVTEGNRRCGARRSGLCVPEDAAERPSPASHSRCGAPDAAP